MMGQVSNTDHALRCLRATRAIESTVQYLDRVQRSIGWTTDTTLNFVDDEIRNALDTLATTLEAELTDFVAPIWGELPVVVQNQCKSQPTIAVRDGREVVLTFDRITDANSVYVLSLG